MREEEASGDAAELENVLDDLARLRLDAHKVSLGYRCVLLLVALAMLLLPILYFAIVGWYALRVGGGY